MTCRKMGNKSIPLLSIEHATSGYTYHIFTDRITRDCFWLPSLEIPLQRIVSAKYVRGLPFVLRPRLEIVLLNADGSTTTECLWLLGWLQKLTGHEPLGTKAEALIEHLVRSKSNDG